MELVEIIAELENYTGKFPRQALVEAIENQEAITPVLLATLEKWQDNLEELLERPDYFLHIYALFLLAQFKETKLGKKGGNGLSTFYIRISTATED